MTIKLPKRCILQLILASLALFSSSVAWATDSVVSDILSSLSFTPSSSDLSIGFLIKIFGCVPGVPLFASASSSIMGTIFEVFNAGVLALSGVFLTYTITKIVTETTMDGSTMGKSATLWTAVRCALSTSLLVPQASGYSIINVLVMWVVVQSVGLANLTWNAALEYLQNGSSLTSSSSAVFDASLIDYSIEAPTGTDNPSNSKLGSADVLRALSCSYMVYDALVSKQSAIKNKLSSKSSLKASEVTLLSNTSTSIGNNGDPYYVYYVDSSNSKNVVYFPYLANEKSNGKTLVDYGLDSIPTLTGICGKFNYSSDDSSIQTAKLAGLKDMISNLNSVAQELVRRSLLASSDSDYLDSTRFIVYASDQKLSDTTVSSLVGKESSINWPAGVVDMVRAAAVYQADIEQSVNTTEDTTSKTAQFTAAKTQGWLGAGGYYRLLASISESAQQEASAQRLSAASGSRDSTYNSYVTALNKESKGTVLSSIASKGKYGSTDTTYQEALKRILPWISLSVPYAASYADTLSSASSASSATTVSSGGYDSTSIQAVKKKLTASFNKAEIIAMISGIVLSYGLPGAAVTTAPLQVLFPKYVLFYMVASIMDTWFTVMNSSTLDPIVKLQTVGTKMMSAALESMNFIKALVVGVSTVTMAGALIAYGLTFSAAPGTLLGATVGLATVGEVLNQLYVLGQTVFNTFFSPNVPLFFAILGPIFTTGVILAVYVPMIPYMLFLFGVISWLLAVVILMVSAPIICFLMFWGNSSQENPLLAREAEQFVMQIVGVFFRPTLMLIGLIVGVIIACVGVDILNIGFNNMFSAILDGVSSGGDTVKTIKMAGGVIIYTFAVVAIVNMGFSAISLVYSEVMRVAGISAPAVSLEEKQMEGIKGGVQQYADAGISGYKEGISSVKPASVLGKAPEKKPKQDPNVKPDDTPPKDAVGKSPGEQ